ncbi:hypothetical protein EIP91_010330 [Steccherinum ochraceum]|uniref:Uncharacterized protein n=1 Tax=Steccherinum ochraceum TaxID=92696 RepID=A0A4R0R2Y6_9APHY|nr:hypothetical protein EIP91_010330 [Steccherinum ochraceum]
MYDLLIRACLLQGEIIVASLLFVLLIKEFAAKTPLVDSYVPDSSVSCAPMRSPKGQPGFNPRILKSIVRDAEATIRLDPEDVTGEHRLFCSLQALANIAMLLERGQLRSGNISFMIRAMYSCPKTDMVVWIVRGDQHVQVKAFPYFQRVLMRLIARLRSPAAASSSFPALDLASYNALLFYALRHRLSPGMATSILEHMANIRQPSLHPNISTYNILLRSATLLRQQHVAVDLLSRLHISTLKQTQPDTEEPYNLPPQAMKASPSVSDSACLSGSGGASSRVCRTQMVIPPAILDAFSSLKPDIATITTYVSYLASTGNPHAVKELLSHLLPELLIPHHFGGASSKAELRRMCIKRVVIYGPYFVAAVLNALVKAGMTGLAERVWILALQAQQASQDGTLIPGAKPWRLSIHAYTTMMQCYAAEAKKSTIKMANGNLHVKGFGRLLYKGRSLVFRRRNETGRRLCLGLFRMVMSRSRTIPKALAAFLREFSPPTSGPPPDARFYNAALDVFYGNPPTLAPSHRRALTKGWINEAARTPLQEVADCIVESGHRLPLSIQEEVDADSDGVMAVRSPMDRTPYAFFTPRGHGAYRLPVAYSRSPHRSRKGRSH